VFVESVPQFGKELVRGFVVVCGQDPDTEIADFIFSGHEVAQKSYIGCRILPKGFYTVNAVGHELHYGVGI
jgi:hypothetical protein